ncbi:MAG: hypothetical protein K2M43_00350 [Mycoplasmoidaceae bacterium]|nr:hypothetical protein [Mycoplasmoidaceae bacterium]
MKAIVNNGPTTNPTNKPIKLVHPNLINPYAQINPVAININLISVKTKLLIGVASIS